MKGKKLYLKAAAVFFSCFLALAIIFTLITNQYVKQGKKQYYYIASSHANIISNSVETAISKVYTLNSLIVAYSGDTSFFDDVAELIYDEVRRYTGINLKSIVLAPNGVVSKVYPLNGNETLIGFDMLDKKKPGNREAFEAYIKGDMIITNPFKSMQSNEDVIAGRLPVFVREKNGKYRFWGLVSITIDFDDLMQEIDLSSLSKMNLDYRLWYSDSKGQKKILIESGKMKSIVATYPFSMKNLKWNLDISPKNGIISKEIKMILLLIITGFSSLISLLYISHERVREVNTKLQYLANRDPLTLCYSRNYLNTVLINSHNGNWIIPHMRYSLLVVDIDYFKDVNDTYGHEVGDFAIKKVSEVLLKNIKREDADCVIRFGGDEFIVLYNDVTIQRLREKIENIMQQTRKIRFRRYPDIRLTLSIGVCPYDSENPLNYYEQVKCADEKLYISKKNGKDRYTF